MNVATQTAWQNSVVQKAQSGQTLNAQEQTYYNSFLASNHPEILKVLNNLYLRNLSTLESYTRTRYGLSGVWVPETMGWDGDANGTINSDYTKNIYSTGTEAALNMYWQYAYTGDSDYLSKTAYPFMKEVVKFYQGKLSVNSGKYYMAVSNAHGTVTGAAGGVLLRPFARLISKAGDSVTTYGEPWNMN